MNSTQIRILKQMHQKRLCSLLQGLNSLRLPPQFLIVWDKCQRDFADEPCEGELEHQEVGRALVLSDFAQRDGAGFVPLLLAVGDWVAGYGLLVWQCGR
jgi:hypothetical protein